MMKNGDFLTGATILMLLLVAIGRTQAGQFIQIISPSSGATVSATVPISVRTRKIVGSISFYIDGKLMGSYKAATHYWNSMTVRNGVHSIGVTVRSSNGVLHSVFERVTVANAVPTSTPIPSISVSSLAVVDTDTNQPISQFNPLVSGTTINRATLPTQNLTIQANTSPASVGSVVFDLVNAKYVNVANTAPYDLCGSTPCSNLGVGLYSLTTTPYTGSNGSGAAGTSMSISFFVIDPTPAASPTATPTPIPTTLTSTLVLTSANNGQTFTNYRISTTSGPCVTITNATNITISNSNIGPCGQNNSDSDSTGIKMIGGSGHHIYDSYIHVENRALTNSFSQTNSHSNIEADSGTTNVTIQGNVICYGAANVRAENGSNGWVVNGNYLCNPRGYDGSGNNFQAVDSWNETVSNNYMYSCQLGGTGTQVICPTSPTYLFTANQEDSVNFYDSSAPGGNVGTVVGNYVAGGISASGCGILQDKMANGLTIVNNTVINGGNCPIGSDGGTNTVITSNKVYGNNPLNGNYVGMYTNHDSAYAGDPYGPCTVTNNISDTSTSNPWWAGNAPTCTTQSGGSISGNTFGAAADTALGVNASMTAAQLMTALPPPLIPPLPKNCVVKSPYSTQTSMASCP